jgi:hypothetical protein
MFVPAILTGTVVSAVSVVGLTTLATGPSDPTTGSGDLRVPCGAVWNRLPADLREDIKAVEDLPDAEKPAAIRAIREDALAGEYGARVARAAERMQDRRARALEQLPEDLQADLEALKALPDEDKVAAAQELRADALAGEYGDKVQTFAERMQQRREACRG